MPHKQAMRECIRDCDNCHDICLETIQYCLKQGGPHAAAEHIGTLRDCAAICEASAEFMLSDSPFHPELCGTCADICTTCEESCLSFEDDEEMRRCAEACEKCAKSCANMAGRKTIAA